jgi:hypothetical protein
LVIDIFTVTDIIYLDKPIIIVNGVYDPESLGFKGFEFGKFLLQIIAGVGFATKLV